MYSNPYNNNNNNNGYPPTSQPGYPASPPQQHGYPGSPPPQHGYPGSPPPQHGYPGSLPPQQGYPGNVYPQAPNPFAPPVSAPGYVPQTTYQPPPSSSAYPPPVSTPGAGMYPPPPAPPIGGGSSGGMYPLPGSPSGNPFGASVTPPFGMPIPSTAGTSMPTAMPTPQGYGQQPYPPPVSVPAHYPQPPQPQSPVHPQYPQHQQSFHHPHQPPQHQQSGSNLVSAGAFKCGPLLRYQNIDIHQGYWLGSVLMVSKAEAYGQPAPVLTWSDGRSPAQHITAQAIDNYNQSIFWRFSLAIPQDPQHSKKITYSVNQGPSYWFFVAGRIAIGGANPMWNDALAKHTEHPYHVMIGGGDQLYCDGLLNEQEMGEWLGITSVDERERTPCKPQWKECIDRYYFNRYCDWFSQGTYGKALAAIPSVNMWDDHDTIDGYGSYPESTQKSPTMQTIGAVSRRFYLLFQHHTTPALVPQHGFFSAGVGENILTSLGPSTSLLVLDARSERTKNLVCSDQTYDLAFTKMYQEIPQGTRHLLVQLGVPIAYPRLVFAENLMGSVGSVLGNIAGAKGVVNRLNGEPELLDDLNDHWTAKAHKPERKKFITRLQNFANDRKIRVTFISGDVHCAGVGRFYAKISPPEKDPQLMYQIISSAIVNEPPPEGVIKLLHFQDKVHILEGRVKTYEDMYPMFTTDVDGKSLQMDRLLPRRNYSHGNFNHHTGGLEITIFAENIRGGPEHTPGADKGTKGYPLHVPRLEA
ncbi:hypothetical protein BGZ76_000131 [Entomortierella beljakovae]|nr:hypothetical protein BGZ76_000131 [Entomortierella beljakovae]